MISDLNPNDSKMLFDAELSPQETTILGGWMIWLGPVLKMLKDKVRAVLDTFVLPYFF